MIVPSSKLIWLTALVGFPALLLQALVQRAAAPALALVATLLLAAGVDAALRSHTLRGITLQMPELVRWTQGRAAAFSLIIHNRGTAAREIRVGFEDPSGLEFQPEDQIVKLAAPVSRVDWQCNPQRRGNFKIERCHLAARTPLGLWEVRASQQVNFEIRVYPNLRDKDSLQALRSGRENLHVIRQIGRGREFEKLREYTPGDSSGDVHWKASARRGRPITKVFQVERTQEIYLALDVSRLSGREIQGETALERSIKAALVVGAVAERRGDQFGVVAFADRTEIFVKARRGKGHQTACREALNGLRTRTASPDFEEIATFLRLRLPKRSLVIFLTSLDEPVLAEYFVRCARLLAKRHIVVTAMLRPASAQPLFQEAEVETTEQIYRSLAGHLAWAKLRELQKTLGQQGIQLALLEPESFSRKIVDLYDDVKQRQLL